jgi:molybdate transport system regulatory protein
VCTWIIIAYQHENQTTLQTGSVSAAARELGMSYRYALERINVVEERLGRTLVERTRGGKAGGGAKLTAFGYELLGDYQGMEGSLNQLTKWYVDLSD